MAAIVMGFKHHAYPLLGFATLSPTYELKRWETTPSPILIAAMAPIKKPHPMDVAVIEDRPKMA